MRTAGYVFDPHKVVFDLALVRFIHRYSPFGTLRATPGQQRTAGRRSFLTRQTTPGAPVIGGGAPAILTKMVRAGHTWHTSPRCKTAPPSRTLGGIEHRSRKRWCGGVYQVRY